MEDIVKFTDRLLHSYGHCHETYRKVEGQRTLHLTRTRPSHMAKAVGGGVTPAQLGLEAGGLCR